MYTRVPTPPNWGGVGGCPPPFFGVGLCKREPLHNPPSPTPSPLCPGGARTRGKGGDEDGGTMRVHGVIAVLGTLLVLATAQRRKWGRGDVGGSWVGGIRSSRDGPGWRGGSRDPGGSSARVPFAIWDHPHLPRDPSVGVDPPPPQSQTTWGAGLDPANPLGGGCLEAVGGSLWGPHASAGCGGHRQPSGCGVGGGGSPVPLCRCCKCWGGGHPMLPANWGGTHIPL